MEAFSYWCGLNHHHRCLQAAGLNSQAPLLVGCYQPVRVEQTPAGGLDSHHRNHHFRRINTFEKVCKSHKNIPCTLKSSSETSTDGLSGQTLMAVFWGRYFSPRSALHGRSTFMRAATAPPKGVCLNYIIYFQVDQVCSSRDSSTHESDSSIFLLLILLIKHVVTSDSTIRRIRSYLRLSVDAIISTIPCDLTSINPVGIR